MQTVNKAVIPLTCSKSVHERDVQHNFDQFFSILQIVSVVLEVDSIDIVVLSAHTIFQTPTAKQAVLFHQLSEMSREIGWCDLLFSTFSTR